jgi:predicted nucleic acid-binding protein
MNDKVADASALAAILFNEDSEADVLRRLGDSLLHATPLIRFELANTCWKKIRRGEDRMILLEKLAALNDWDIQFHDIDVMAVTALAADTGLTAYDASYLWLARALGAELVTLDAQLDAVATAHS